LIPISFTYQNLHPPFLPHLHHIQSNLTLPPTPNLASKRAIRETIPFPILPTIHSLKTYALLSIPPIITPLIIPAIPPLQPIKFQLLLLFIHTTPTIISPFIPTYLTYPQFFNAPHQLLPPTTNIKHNN
ncbi:ABC transporter permease, partial [Staphylococcus hominis]|uniref:ABC transporter permease n=1 Tax=Staphylococcus hominis TaxID=1290 RepID=UPI001643DD48